MAQDRRPPSSPAELRLSYAPIVQRVQPAVVNVFATKVVQNRNPLLDDPIFRRFFGVPGDQPEQMQRSLGSGVMVDPSGLVVTNVHVIEGADQVKVSLSDKREFEAEIVLKDPRSDLAVLRLKDTHEKFPTLDFANSDELMVGDVVLAIGNPFGVGQTVTHGIISALARTQVGITDYQFFIQTDARDQSRQFGRRAGRHDRQARRHQYRDLLALRRLAGHRLCDSRQHGAGRGRVRQERRQGRQAAVARCAIAGGDARDRRDAGLKLPNGALVASVVAEQSGGEGRTETVRPDRRRSTGRRSTIPTRSTIASRPARSAARAQIDVQRAGKPLKLTIALETAPDSGRSEIVLTSRSPFQGAKVANISPAVADELHLDADTEGVVVTDLAEDGTAANVGFQKGDIILAVNNQKIAKTGDLEKATRDVVAGLAHHAGARRPADQRHARRMSPKRPRETATLFAAAGMERDAPHPLPDRLRPRALSDVVGQDHILGPTAR